MATKTERITPNGHRVVIYNPRRYCKRTLFNRVLKELKSRVPKPINWFAFVLLELNDYFKKRPIYFRGKMYEYRWVLPTYSRIEKYYKDDKGNTIYRMSKDEFLKRLLKKNPVMEFAMDTFGNQIYNKEGKWRDMNNVELLKYVDKHWINRSGGCDILKTLNETFCKRKANVPMFRMKFEIGRMDLSKTPIARYSVLNLKRWDKKTKKTSNKGLKADTTYSWSENGMRGGWTFDGICVDNLKMLYKQNGMKIAKGMQYGDYAEWYLKL